MIDLFLPYQKAWILDKSKTAMYVKSRRIGITWAESFRAVIDTLQQKHDYNFVSANLKTSQEFITYCRKWCEIINESAGAEYIDLCDTTTTEIRFPTGNKIIALSSNPDALRGRSGSCTLDEIAFHDQPELIYKAAQALPLWGGRMRLISSVSHPDSWFSQQVSRAENGELPWSLHQSTILDSVAEGLAVKVPGEHQKLLPDIKACNSKFLKDLEAEVGSDAAWQQEFLCQPASHSMLIVPEQYDNLALEELNQQLDSREYGDLFIGVDIGRVKDLSVIWVLERGVDKDAPHHLRDVYRTVAVQSVKGMTFEAQAQLISKYLTNKNIVKCCIDKTGLGMMLSEQLRSEHGSIIEGVSISSPEKQSLVERTLKFFSQERVSLPKDENIKSDVVCLRRIITKKGNVSYDGRSNVGHGDYFIALAMALRAADKTSSLELTTK